MFSLSLVLTTALLKRRVRAGLGQVIGQYERFDLIEADPILPPSLDLFKRVFLRAFFLKKKEPGPYYINESL